jgi:organic hydroperoxide reductase OsmC/OhrA
LQLLDPALRPSYSSSGRPLEAVHSLTDSAKIELCFSKRVFQTEKGDVFETNQHSLLPTSLKMAEITIHLRNVHGTEAALGWAGSQTVIVDRPEGKAGGNGLGFNGGELLGLAIGGYLCNDLRYVAHDLGVSLNKIEVDVTVQFEGNPTKAVAATVAIRVDAAADKPEVRALIQRAVEISTVANSVRSGFPVTVIGAENG